MCLKVSQMCVQTNLRIPKKDVKTQSTNFSKFQDTTGRITLQGALTQPPDSTHTFSQQQNNQIRIQQKAC